MAAVVAPKKVTVLASGVVVKTEAGVAVQGTGGDTPQTVQ